ncbi:MULTISPECIES: hypothetical protein [unclassified Tolypothrix]|nr:MULTISPECIES: hypothetical protein [unclassified Tolypothrix]UYD37062.1 hypothetical protein HG267_15850 [Tolypothrix sp. PCC 7601]
MGHGEEITNAQCPMPNAQCPMPNAPCGGAAVPLHPQGDGVSRRFQ